jgi:cellulose synthase/poly-beta-1,6-N-acetylglucosamine synthase-like glycosyltransferase
MSKNFRDPRPAPHQLIIQNGQFQIEQNSVDAIQVNPSADIRQFKVPATPYLNGQYEEEQNQVEQLDTHPVLPAYPSNGVQPLQVPSTPRIFTPDTPPSIVPVSPFPFAPATPAPWAEPAFADPRRQERIERYTQWLSANNSLTVSPQTLQAYQDASLEFKQVRNREVRTFAPFQERTSALQVVTSNQLAVFGALALAWVAGLVLLHLVLFTITLAIITLLYISGFITSSILATNSFRSKSGEKIDEEIITALDERRVEWPTYTILCPLYKESAIVPQFVEAIKSLDYPSEKLQVLFLTEENDSETRMALYNMRLPRGFTVLTVPQGSPQTKPRACNFGLLQAKGQFIVIFDAEDKPEPYQLKKAVLTFANHGPEIACVQAKLNYYNARQNLLTRWFTAEYSTWFDIMLPGLQKSGFSLPLGGTSNHFRTEVLRVLGGWDAFNVTEDCDLGLRISQYGLKTAVLDSTTFEEATSRVKVWLFQRSRWIKGYLQTYLVHMRHPVQTLQQRHFRKFFSLQLIVGAWTVVLLINPFMWALTLIYILFRPVQLYSVLFPGPILYMGAFCLIFGNFFYVYIHLIGCVRRREYALIKWVLLIPLYWIMMSMSAYIAFYQLIVKPHYWEKTQHGTHLASSAYAQARHLAPTFVHDGQAVVVSMPTTRLFAVTVGRIFKQTAVADELGTTTQRVKVVRGMLLGPLGKHKDRRKMHQPRTRDLWLLATIGTSGITSIVACWYYFLQHEINLYNDALGHMRLSRMVFDSATPGLAQLGGESVKYFVEVIFH